MVFDFCFKCSNVSKFDFFKGQNYWRCYKNFGFDRRKLWFLTCIGLKFWILKLPKGISEYTNIGFKNPKVSKRTQYFVLETCNLAGKW